MNDDAAVTRRSGCGGSGEVTFLVTEEAAELLRLSPRTLERLRVSGGGPKHRTHGKRVVYAVSDLLTWSDRHGRTSTSERSSSTRPSEPR